MSKAVYAVAALVVALGLCFVACAPAATGARLLALARQAPDTVLLMPVDGLGANDVADSWAAPRGGGRLHEGQDLFADRGTPVLSATRGIVTAIVSTPLGGNVVWVAGAGRRRYYYAHLETTAADLEVGQWVTPDTTLGFVGTSGNANGTPPHLHLAVYTPDGAIDPLPMLADR